MMRLFISYARVDKFYAVEVVRSLEMHDIWFDQRLHAGQQWWAEIRKRLEWCEGFVYLLSPDSVASAYCQKEFEIALHLNKHIFPVLIDSSTKLPNPLARIHYVDFSAGIAEDEVKRLIESIYVAERQSHFPIPQAPSNLKSLELIISTFDDMMGKGDLDGAVAVLREGQTEGFNTTAITILLEAAEKRRFEQKAMREYIPIAALLKHQQTHKIGLDAFRAFRQEFPGYDPENLSDLLKDMPKTGHIFLSYSRHDTTIMRQIKKDLENVNCGIWVDETNLEPGTRSWKRTIQTAIEEASCLVVMLSPDAKQSMWVEAELDYAETQSKTIFSILIRGDKSNAVPFGYTSAQWVDIVKNDYDTEMQKLINSIRKHLNLS